jgi:hypothetical protein
MPPLIPTDTKGVPGVWPEASVGKPLDGWRDLAVEPGEPPLGIRSGARNVAQHTTATWTKCGSDTSGTETLVHRTATGDIETIPISQSGSERPSQAITRLNLIPPGAGGICVRGLGVLVVEPEPPDGSGCSNV